MEAGYVEYEARRRRSSWSESVRCDAEVKALDEVNGEWILCATCATHFQRTGRGRRPNDPLGFKVKMNGRFQEAAWVMHKSRVVAHRLGLAQETGKKRRSTENDEDDAIFTNTPEVDGHAASELATEGLPSMLMDDYAAGSLFAHYTPASQDAEPVVQIPLSGWRCPGIVPDEFYRSNSELVHAFAKYYVGSYRINVVRDIRTDRVLLFSHECENQVVQRSRMPQCLACRECHNVWIHHKNFRRILKKMERYNHVEDLLRRTWSLSGADLDALSRFKHASAANLNIEGRKLKQAVIDVLRHFGTPQPVNEKAMIPSTDNGEAQLILSATEVGGEVNRPEHASPSAITALDVTVTTEHMHGEAANI